MPADLIAAERISICDRLAKLVMDFKPTYKVLTQELFHGPQGCRVKDAAFLPDCQQASHGGTGLLRYMSETEIKVSGPGHRGQSQETR